jgi:hypothetical protein
LFVNLSYFLPWVFALDGVYNWMQRFDTFTGSSVFNRRRNNLAASVKNSCCLNSCFAIRHLKLPWLSRIAIHRFGAELGTQMDRFDNWLPLNFASWEEPRRGLTHDQSWRPAGLSGLKKWLVFLRASQNLPWFPESAELNFLYLLELIFFKITNNFSEHILLFGLLDAERHLSCRISKTLGSQWFKLTFWQIGLPRCLSLID